jgi:hypothetical protein
MLGSALGWRIAVFILVAGIGGGLWLRSQMQVTDPTSLSLDEKNLAVLAPPLPATPIVSRDVSGDAGEKYSQAAASYQENPDACDDWSQKPDGALPAPVQAIVDATHYSQMNLFARDPGNVIDYQQDHPPLDNLFKLGQEMESAALLLQRSGKTAEARQLLEAAYALGENLLGERVDYDEYSHGMGLVNGALTALAELEPANSAKAQALTDAETAMEEFDKDRVTPVYDVLASADPTKIAANAGDIFRFAMVAQERMFRVEAILKLGRYRFDSARAADQLAAPRILRELGHDPDPAVQAAASAAAALTLEQYRMIH